MISRVCASITIDNLSDPLCCMFDVLTNQDQLAAIVGYEIGHLQAEHGQERINAQVATGWGRRALSFILEGAELEGAEVEYAEEIAAALGIGVKYGLVLPYSRRQELEAVLTMAKAGYSPSEAVALWQRMDVATANRPPEFLATHPAPQSRIAAIEAMLLEL